MSTIVNPPVPIFPKFISVEGCEDNNSKICRDSFKIRLVSYNILAQAYVKSSLFPHSPSPCLRWKARSQAVLSVLNSFETDFLCIQELDEYDNFYKEHMEKSGYSSIYIQRNGKKRDGCGIFYNNCAELLLEDKIKFNDLVPSHCGDKHDQVLAKGNQDGESKDGAALRELSEDCGDPNDPCVRLKRDCVGLMAAFKLKEPPHHIVIVANTHFYWDPEWADVKLAQAKYLMLRIGQFKDLVSNQFGATPSIILSGDFNSTPGDEVYQYLVSGNSSPSSGRSNHRIPLCSAYAQIKGEPMFTNYTPGFTGTLDYILFSPSNDIKVVSLLHLPESEASDIVGGLPNYYHPSDHLPIGAEFTIAIV